MLKINIYNTSFELECDNELLLSKLASDFSYFVTIPVETNAARIKITAKKSDLGNVIPENLVVFKKSNNSLKYRKGKNIFYDYYGKAITVLDDSYKDFSIYYKDLDYTHELIYLLILSISGKNLDLAGLHKVHACGVCYHDQNLLFIMSSKGGKTTTFCNLIKDETLNIISDDTPLVNKSGDILPFPLRVGFEDKDYLKKTFSFLKDEDIYEFNRENYSKKYLVSLTKFPNEVAAGLKDTILVHGRRSTYSEPKIARLSRLRMFFILIEHMVVGIGLPMVVEYFLRHNIKDHLLNLKILFSRLRSCSKLVLKARTYEIYLTSDIDKNTRLLKALFDE